MASKYKQDDYVKCPYYCKESPVDVKCIGICGTHTIQCFESGKAKESYKEDFCIGYYWNCPCYIALITDEK